MKQHLKKVLFGPIDWFVYGVLNENQRKALTERFSDEQKERIKHLFLGKQQAQREELKQIKYHLYNLGFTTRAQADLETFFQTMHDPHLKRLAAWELVLWHANQNTEAGSQEALKYIEAAKDGEQDENQKRRIAIVEAECYDAIGEREKAREVIHSLLKMQSHADLYLAAANLEDTVEKRLEWINKVMENYNLQPIAFADAVADYDHLQTQPLERSIEDGPKVSIILPAFKAEVGVRVAIESILNQTWKNIELLAVDDCSPDNTARVIKEYAARDPRVKLLSTPVNSGPYVARNIALQNATGEFITINDADDWSHAEKIERQVMHLIENKQVIANTSAHARLTEEITLYRRGTPGKYIFPNMSSIMFRREPVLEKVGYWDSVRFAGDGEFKRRLVRVFGKNSYVDLESGPLSLPRQSVTSLTASSAFGYDGFFMGVRREYVEAMETYHRTASSLHYDYPMKERAFQVPEPMWPNRALKVDGKREVDIVLVADFSMENEHILQIAKQAVARQKQVGLISLHQYMTGKHQIRSEYRDLINQGKLEVLVYGEKIKANKLFVLDEKALDTWQRYVPEVEAVEMRVLLTEKHDVDKLTNYRDHMASYFGDGATWHAASDAIRAAYKTDETDRIIQFGTVFDESWVYDE